jgi:hypothetical protein
VQTNRYNVWILDILIDYNPKNKSNCKIMSKHVIVAFTTNNILLAPQILMPLSIFHRDFFQFLFVDKEVLSIFSRSCSWHSREPRAEKIERTFADN